MLKLTPEELHELVSFIFNTVLSLSQQVRFLLLQYVHFFLSLLYLNSVNNLISTVVTLNKGGAIAQAVSRRLPTAAARVRAQVRSSGICGGQSGTGAGFLRVLRFPLPILIPPTAPQSSSIIRVWYNSPTYQVD
jgi:hypothetical protein